MTTIIRALMVKTNEMVVIKALGKLNPPEHLRIYFQSSPSCLSNYHCPYLIP